MNNLFVLLFAASVIAFASDVMAADSDSLATNAIADTSVSAVAEPSATQGDGSTDNGLTYLVPEMKDAGWKVTDDRNRFKHRISFSPAYGKLGSEDLFAFRVGYSPNVWLGYEASLGHNPASSLH